MISSPRWAGRQCSTTASSAASPTSRPSIRYPANACRRTASSASAPIETQVSVKITSAPATASSGVDAQTIRPPSPRPRATTAGSGAYAAGAATRTSMPVRPAARIRELQTLLPSPTHAATRPSVRPKRSRMVKMSARSWHGCSRSESPLITGTVAWAANSSIVSWRLARIITAET